MVRRKRIQKYNISKTLGITSSEWVKLRKLDKTPPPDGKTWGGSSLVDFWYEDTLIEWWEGMGRRVQPREYRGHRRRDILGREL
jgi:hypothetical protein